MADVDIKTQAISLLGAVDAVNLGDTATSATIYTVPTGFTCILDHVIIRNFSATAAAGIVTVGHTGTLTDFLPSQTLTACNSTESVAIMRPVPSATVVKHIQYVAADALILDVGTPTTGACTATVEFWGRIQAV